jgi:hypothetical protein
MFLSWRMLRQAGRVFLFLAVVAAMACPACPQQEPTDLTEQNIEEFSNIFNSQMLVLVDGRLVYTPLFGGVW